MKKTRGKTNSAIVTAAREQRRKPTQAEERLWEALRGRKHHGLKFRRQHPYDHFILDYLCVEFQLVVEVDGGIHKTEEQSSHDRSRTEFLEMHGIRVLRFTNEEIESNLEEVLQKIFEVTRT